MSTIAQQLRLAANILETGHPWEYYAPFRAGQPDPHWERASTRDEPVHHVHNRREIRPVLATPPDGRPLHNPDNLTAEQVGVGYRLVVKNDSCDQPHDLWSCEKRKWVQGARMCCTFEDSVYTYRIPLSVPWPTPPIDPYAELKAAHAAGKVIQGLIGGHWIDSPHPTWKYPAETYREKPEEPIVCAVPKPDAPPSQLPPPPPGMQWHRTDGWKAEDLPPGTRPHVLDEEDYPEDSERRADGWRSCTRQKYGTTDEDFHRRTTRPLVFEHEGKSWTYHRPGDPIPCDGERKVHALFEDLEIRGANDPTLFGWGTDVQWKIIGWRYAEPTTREVELGPEDVPPGSVVRPDHWTGPVWINVEKVCVTDCLLAGESGKSFPWAYLKAHGWLINRPRHRDADGNPTKWEKCSKTITTP